MGTVLGSIFRGLVPLFSKGASVVGRSAAKFVKSDLGKAAIKSVKKSAKKAALKGVGRLVSGEDVLTGAKRDLKDAADDIGHTLGRAADSVGKKKKKSSSKRKQEGGEKTMSGGSLPHLLPPAAKRYRKSVHSLI